MNVFLGFLAVSIVVAAWIILFKVIPDSLMAMFRFRLWKQRDDLAAELRESRFSEQAPAEKVIELVEAHIVLAAQLSPMHIALMRISELGMPEPTDGYIDLGALPSDERALLERRLERINQLVADHVLLETPSGWLTVVFGIPLAAVVVVFKRLKRNGYGGTLIGGLRRRLSDGSRELTCRERVV